MREPTPTPRQCPCCAGGSTDARESCYLCKGKGQVDASTASRWVAWRNLRTATPSGTSGFLGIEEVMRAQVLQLEAHVHVRADLVDLLNEGKGLLRVHGNASKLPAGSDERGRAVAAFTDFIGRSRQALMNDPGGKEPSR